MKKRSHYLSLAFLASTSFTFSSSSFADVTVNSVITNQSFLTSVKGNIEIAPNGQLVMNLPAAPPPNGPGDGIVVDSQNAVITLDANNLNPDNNAIITNAPARYGINLFNFSPGIAANALINVGKNTSIKANSDGIFVDQLNAIISNDGKITSNTSSINLSANGQNTNIINGQTGYLEGLNAPTVLINGKDSLFLNQGNIVSVLNDGVRINQNITQFINDTTGIILSTAGSALNINGALTVNGDIQNDGILRTNGAGNGVLINNTYSGVFTNNNLIQSNAGLGTAVTLGAQFNIFNNRGLIEGFFNDDQALVISQNNTSTFNNLASGIIRSIDKSPVLINANLGGLNNSGTITTNATNGIEAALNVVVTNGITNTGIIKAATNAVNLSQAKAPFFQIAGAVTGNILLDKTSTNSFSMTGGTVTGNVIANGTNPSGDILNLNGGVIVGNVNLTNMGSTVNLGGTTVNIINGGTGSDIFNLSGGNFTQLIGGLGANKVNVNASFTANGNIQQIQTIQLNNNETLFTVNQPITGIDTLLKLSASTTLNANANLAGNGVLQNAGILNINNALVDFDVGTPAINTGIIQINNIGKLQVSDFTNFPSGALVVNSGSQALLNKFINQGTLNINEGGLVQAASYQGVANSNYIVGVGPNPGLLKVSGPGIAGKFELNSFITPQISAQSGLIQDGSTYTIAQATGGTLSNNATLAMDNSATISFTSQLIAGDTLLQLVANRNSFTDVEENQTQFETTQGVAQALDQIAQPPGPADPSLLNLLIALDLQPNASALNDALLQLIPPHNYGMIAASRLSMHTTFTSIQRHLEDLNDANSQWQTGQVKLWRLDEDNGFNYGDTKQAKGWNLWIDGHASYFNQNKRREIAGYDLEGIGAILGADWELKNGAKVGLAFSGNKAQVKNKNTTRNIQEVESLQGTVYGFFEPYPSFFWDNMLGVAVHHYKTRRNISIETIQQTAFADFSGIHYGIQSEGGYAFQKNELTIAPLVRVRYSHLDIDNYTEEGADGLNLSVDTEGFNELTAGLGLRLAMQNKTGATIFVPQFQGMMLYDFYGDRERTIANFMGGGPSFLTKGIKPHQAYYLFELGLNIHSPDNYVFSAKYELEIRDHFIGNTAYVKLGYHWG